MAVTRSLFRNISQHVSKPDHIVNALNQAQSEGNDTNMFVTLFVGVLDLKTGKLCYCNAGHDAPLLLGREVKLLPCECNLPIGVIADFKFEQQEVTLERPSTIFLFTDGLNEAENIDHAQFGDERIKNIAESLITSGQLEPMQVIRHMTDAVHTFVGTAEQSDDLTMLAIEIK
jgi:sigma-B regulation protein RsbU (phosphoserine phosphatase)